MTTDKPFVPSPQQSALIEWGRNGKGSVFCDSVAGSGKTTVCEKVSRVMTGQIIYLVFNKKNEREAAAKMPKNVVVKTFHGLGCGTLYKVYPQLVNQPDRGVDNYKVRNILVNLEIETSIHGFISKIVSLAKQRALGLFGDVNDAREWFKIVDHFDMYTDLENPEDPNIGVEACINIAMKVLKISNDLVSDKLAPRIDFDDMIYIPVLKGLRMWQYDNVLVDEAQDTNPARRAMVRRILKPYGRAMFVGDTRQGIYGFTGADANAVELIMKEFNCKMMPLTVTYRCPKAVVRMAQTVVDHIQAHESAPEGALETIYNNELFDNNRAGIFDAIICRKTKPLIETAFKFIRKGVACRVEGKDIGKGLINLINKYKTKNIDVLKKRLENYMETETARLIAKSKETQAEALQDRIETIFVLMEGCPDVDCVRNKIEMLFKDSDGEAKQMLTLSTIHKAKGREWGTVYVLGYDTHMPSKAARQAWQIEQENNMIYVAYTRSKDKLVLVRGADKVVKPEDVQNGQA